MPPSQDVLQWQTLNDFTPGIFSQKRLGTVGTAAPVPVGAAQETNTYRCIALPRGGLAPLPKRADTITIADPEAAAGLVSPNFQIVGFWSFGPMVTLDQYLDEHHLYVSYLYNDAGTTHEHTRWLRVQTFTAGSPKTTDTLKSSNASGAASLPVFTSADFMTTRMNDTAAFPITDPGVPVVVASWASGAGGGVAATPTFAVFPDPLNPGLTGIRNVDTAGRYSLFGHQGRVIYLEPRTDLHGAVGALIQDEQFNFSEVNNVTFPAKQRQVFVPEYPSGYSSFGSISAGELFLVKSWGGGVLVQGDVADPTIRRLPGVVSGGGIFSRGCSTPIGFMYPVLDGGVHLWRGADTSTKISEQLDDHFSQFLPFPGFTGRGVTLVAWQDWMVMTNNWLYDTVLQSWWRLEDPAVFTIWQPANSFQGHRLWACATGFDSTHPPIHLFDRTIPASTYSWQSHPMSVSVNQSIDVRELALRAQGTGTVTITLTPYAGEPAFAPIVFTIASPNVPVLIRQKCRAQGENITVRIQADSGGSGPAPIVYELRMGYNAQMHGSEV